MKNLDIHKFTEDYENKSNSLDQVQKTHNISVRMVQRYALNLRLKRNHHKQVMIDEVVRLYTSENLSCSEISKIVNLTAQQIEKLLSIRNIKKTENNRNQVRKRRIKELCSKFNDDLETHRELLTDLYCVQNKSHEEICAIFGTSWTPIAKVLRKLSITRPRDKARINRIAASQKRQDEIKAHLDTIRPLANQEILRKYGDFGKLTKWKSYTLPSGKEIKMQGYEPWAWDLLLETHNEDDISRCGVVVPYSVGQKTFKYYPDIFITSENKVIEVKSEYTFKRNFDVNIQKAKATVAAGFNYEIWVFDSDRRLTVKTAF